MIFKLVFGWNFNVFCTLNDTVYYFISWQLNLFILSHRITPALELQVQTYNFTQSSLRLIYMLVYGKFKELVLSVCKTT